MKAIQYVARFVLCFSSLAAVLYFAAICMGEVKILYGILYVLLSIVGIIAGIFFNNLMELKMRRRARNSHRIYPVQSPLDIDLIEYRRVF